MTPPAPQDAGEETLVAAIHPAARSIALRSWRVVTLAIAMGVICSMASRFTFPGAHWLARWGPLIWALLGGARLGWEFVVWINRSYALTSRRVIASAGVFRRVRVDIPLHRVQQVVVDRTLGERLLGLGTVLVTSAGSQSDSLAWVMVAEPDSAAELVRARLTGGSGAPLVIGLAGGIGSGKSAVAGVFASRGYVVLDSDAQAKEALDRPAVRAELVKWWGSRILTPDGRVNRKALADVIFADPAERQRLEALVHPLVRAERASLIARASAAGAPGVIVDAPLLFEAGSDAECDLVIFVEAPEGQRLARVLQTRGWSADELRRREKAQIPLETKRARSDLVIVNDADLASLVHQVDAAITSMGSLPRRGRQSSPPGGKHGNRET
ncbi:MAG: dephospho-CoA kinase [Phycisphaerales bacterium]|nr:dephospho-CoA kinase [Phycisphaerales bacterium]